MQGVLEFLFVFLVSALILPSARRGFLTLPWVNCGGYPVPGQPFGVGLPVAHVKFHIAGRGLGEYQRGGAP